MKREPGSGTRTGNGVARVRFGLAALLIAALGASGCAAPFGVRRASPREVQRTLTGNILSTGELSDAARIELRRQNLLEAFETHPEQALATLHARLAAGQGQHDEWYALAELSFAYAAQAKSRPQYLAAALYAYTFAAKTGPSWELSTASEPRK